MPSRYIKFWAKMTDAPTEPRSTVDLVTNFIVSFLTPTFLSMSDGDSRTHRSVATETICRRMHSQADLLSIAQVIALGLVTVGALSLSMAENFPAFMIFNPLADADGPDKASEKGREPTMEPPTDTAAPLPPRPDNFFSNEAAVAGAAEQAHKQEAELQTRVQMPEFAPPRKQRPIIFQKRWPILADAAADAGGGD